MQNKRFFIFPLVLLVVTASGCVSVTFEKHTGQENNFGIGLETPLPPAVDIPNASIPISSATYSSPASPSPTTSAGLGSATPVTAVLAEPGGDSLVKTQPATGRLVAEITFDILANQGWQKTGLDIQEGDLVSIEYQSGLWTDYAGVVKPFDADGDPGYKCANIILTCVEPMPERTKGGLIARVGGATPTFIGSRASFQAINYGPLQLMMNDSLYPGDWTDNEGSVTVRIKVTR